MLLSKSKAKKARPTSNTSNNNNDGNGRLCEFCMKVSKETAADLLHCHCVHWELNNTAQNGDIDQAPRPTGNLALILKMHVI